jgi:hypothetical protein
MIAEPDDGQLHTLGLLERLRAETNLVQGSYAGLYQRVDKLLRELENPNLHDIANPRGAYELPRGAVGPARAAYPLGYRRCGICVPGARRFRGSREAVARSEADASAGDNAHQRTSPARQPALDISRTRGEHFARHVSEW